jgi:hypothetical protein
MKTFDSEVSHVRVRRLFCCCAGLLLAACGGGSGNTADDPPIRLAGISSTMSTDDAVAAVAMRAAPGTTVAIIRDRTANDHVYVAADGSDANPGTQAAPFLTIAHADSRASAGSTVHVAPGTYDVSAPKTNSAGIRTTRNGTPFARIRFVSDVIGAAKIVMSGNGIAWNSKGDYVDIEGFDITGSGRIGILAEGANVTVTWNIVHDLTVSGGCNGGGGAGIDAWGPSGGAVIDSNVVRNIGYQWVAARSCNTVQGIYVTNQNNRISNNIVSGVASVGINSWHGATASTIVNNTIFNSKMGIVIGHGDSGTTPNGTENNYVANNIVYDNRYGITEMGKVGGNNRYVNNLVKSTGRDWRVQGAVTGTISADPLFVDYQSNGSGNYRVYSGSPAIDNGTPVEPLTTDISGVARPRNAAIDIGAYEF